MEDKQEQCRKELGVLSLEEKKQQPEVPQDVRPGKIVFVCHGDTNFSEVSCVKVSQQVVKGHMDNFAGVFTVLSSYFQGDFPSHNVRIEITYGEEESMENSKGEEVDFVGARDVMKTIDFKHDLVVVVDVTSLQHEPDLDFSIEKCKSEELKKFIDGALSGKGFNYKVYLGTDDDQACQDETDAFREITQQVFFFGICVYGGDYNRVPVFCNMEKLRRASKALALLAHAFNARTTDMIVKQDIQDNSLAQMLSRMTVCDSDDKVDYQTLICKLNQKNITQPKTVVETPDSE